MKSNINTPNYIKTKGTRGKERMNELSEIKKEIDKSKRENTQQSKSSNIEKENNIKTIEKF